jgi:hypothetical protein
MTVGISSSWYDNLSQLLCLSVLHLKYIMFDLVAMPICGKKMALIWQQ